MPDSEKIKIRFAKPEDKCGLIRLVIELAEFENLEPPDSEAQKRLLKETFKLKPRISVLVAEHNKTLIGYAIYFYTFSSFRGLKTLYLEDIFVTESKRGLGVGKMFFDKLLQIANKSKCGRMEWCVLKWNKNAIKFYKKLGAKPLNEWAYYRLDF